jgi:hypothetical protein
MPWIRVPHPTSDNRSLWALVDCYPTHIQEGDGSFEISAVYPDVQGDNADQVWSYLEDHIGNQLQEYGEKGLVYDEPEYERDTEF